VLVAFVRVTCRRFAILFAMAPVLAAFAAVTLAATAFCLVTVLAAALFTALAATAAFFTLATLAALAFGLFLRRSIVVLMFVGGHLHSRRIRTGRNIGSKRKSLAAEEHDHSNQQGLNQFHNELLKKFISF
jgi:hypothetical protein